MARIKSSAQPLKRLSIKRNRNHSTEKNGKKPVCVEIQTKTRQTGASAANSSNDLNNTIRALSKTCSQEESTKLTAAEFLQASRRHQVPVLSLLKAVSCSADIKHNTALCIPVMTLSDKERSDEEISSELVRDRDSILKWAIFSSDFPLVKRQGALRFLCGHLKNSNPKRKSLRFWMGHFFNEDCGRIGFRMDSIITFGKSLPAKFKVSTTLKLLKNLLSLNELGFARLLASESNITLTKNLRQELRFESGPLQMPSNVKISVVGNRDSAKAAETALLSSIVVGIDTETQPQFKKGVRQNPVSIVQIATLSEVFILDLLKASDFCAPIIAKLLRSPSILKLGLGLRDDLVQLQSTYLKRDFANASAIVDLNDMFSQRYPDAAIKSLARLTLFSAGRTLSKGQQMSNWAVRPLSDSQIQYASLDAFVCLQIASQLVDCDLTAEAIAQSCSRYGKEWEYCLGDDPGCMWVRPW